jgi:hypothetical protein
MTNEQRQVLKRQVVQVQDAQRAWDREVVVLKAMLLMHDARFADPASGMEFNAETMEITGGSHADSVDDASPTRT